MLILAHGASAGDLVASTRLEKERNKKMSFYEKAAESFSRFENGEITVETCQKYLDSMRLNDCFGGVNVPYGMTANLLKDFLVGRKTQDDIRRILFTAERAIDLLNLHNGYRKDAELMSKKLSAADFEDGETAESVMARRNECLAKADAYWSAIEIMYIPVNVYNGLKVIDIDRMV